MARIVDYVLFMTNLDMNNTSSSINASLIWTAPAKARRGRPAAKVGKIQMRIESIVMGLLISTDGSLRMEEISKVTGYTAEQIRPVMMQLIANGSVRRSGNTRGTRYTAVAL